MGSTNFPSGWLGVTASRTLFLPLLGSQTHLTCNIVYSLPIAVVINYPKLGELEQNKFIISQFRMSESEMYLIGLKLKLHSFWRF